MGHYYVGVLDYADDVALIVPSVRVAKYMLRECKLFAVEYDVMFNS